MITHFDRTGGYHGTKRLFDPRYPYRGSDQPENMLFNANLQEFAQQVSYIAALQTNGKMSTYESYKKIKQQWKRLKKTHKQLT
ncbi:hypothetical protein AP9108_25390 [Arthrospira sp. PCC 9108]|nr:hypothetical protein AP9108_25390 [Arthrospira sp. PCC 9108]